MVRLSDNGKFKNDGIYAVTATLGIKDGVAREFTSSKSNLTATINGKTAQVVTL